MCVRERDGLVFAGVQVVLCGAFYPNYFHWGVADEEVNRRLFCGHNHCTTVMVSSVYYLHAPVYYLYISVYYLYAPVYYLYIPVYYLYAPVYCLCAPVYYLYTLVYCPLSSAGGTPSQCPEVCRRDLQDVLRLCGPTERTLWEGPPF